jgi:hypothetical protein
MNRKERNKAIHDARVLDIKEFIIRGIDRALTTRELNMLETIPEQVLHLLAAAIIENEGGKQMNKTRLFTATSNDHAQFNGPVEIIRSLTKAEADIFDVGVMYECKASNGALFHAFADELTVKPRKETNK